jgi:hypothetical protein
MSRHAASDLAIRLGRQAEAVCRHYLSNGTRQGRYWIVGDVRNAHGRSMFVRLNGPEAGPGAAGHWTDAATAEFGDLLDVIRETRGLVDFKDVAEEARRFLSLPRPEPEPDRPSSGRTCRSAPGSLKAARRLFAMAQPIPSIGMRGRTWRGDSTVSIPSPMASTSSAAPKRTPWPRSSPIARRGVSTAAFPDPSGASQVRCAPV